MSIARSPVESGFAVRDAAADEVMLTGRVSNGPRWAESVVRSVGRFVLVGSVSLLL